MPLQPSDELLRVLIAQYELTIMRLRTSRQDWALQAIQNLAKQIMRAKEQISELSLSTDQSSTDPD